ncbi:MAG: hypothetical protein NVSMB23_21860 [Myxococcales bacterium]
MVLLSPDAAELARWAAALDGAVRIRTAKDLAELAATLARDPAEVVIAPCDARLLEGIQRFRAGARLIVCGPVAPQGIIDAASEGYDLRHVASADALRGEVHALARPRSLTVRHQLRGLYVRWAGAERPVPVVDVSNSGLSLRLELDGPVESLLPGVVLSGVEVQRGPSLALSADFATVRYVEQVSDPGQAPHYRVGCALSAHPAGRGRGLGIRLSDGVARLGLLRAALRGAGIFLHGQDATAPGILCPRGQIDAGQASMTLEAPGAGFEPYEVVRGSFELGGNSLGFVTSVMAAEPLTLRLPPDVEIVHRRGSARYRPDVRKPVTAELTAPLIPGGPLPRLVLELSSTGFSFALDPAFDLFPPGMRLSRIEIRLPGFTLACPGVVMNLAPLPGDPQALRCGVSFEGLDAAARARLADATMRHRYPGLEDGRALSFEQIFRFFQETRFMYPEKLAALEPFMPEVRRTFTQLQSRESGVFKSLIYREGGKTLAHGSCVRVFRRTFVLQHLAGITHRLSRKPAPQVLNLGLAEYFAQSTDLEYLKFFFRPDNRWPSRVFGGFARKLSDRQLSDLRTFDYLGIDTGIDLPEPEGVRVIEAGPGDLGIVERHFVASERGLLLRSDDLTRGALPLGELDAEFGALGLTRRRVVLLALRGDEPAGFALCELSSPGMNLSELFSAFRVHLLPAAGAADDPARRNVALALQRAALQLYRRAGRPLAVGLFPEGDEAARILPALTRKQYTCWTVHRSLCPSFCEHVDRLYQMLNQGRRKKELANDAVPDGELIRGDAA